MNACLYSCVFKTYLHSKKMYSDIYRLKRTYLQLRFLQDLAFGRQSCLQPNEVGLDNILAMV